MRVARGIAGLLDEKCEQTLQIGKADTLAGARVLKRSAPRNGFVPVCPPQAQQV
jgi:hypothetical protein